MSREQLTESQAQPSERAAGEHGDVETGGLPPYIYQQVIQLPPGIPERLVQVLKMYPALSKQICDVASQYLGMSTVKQALEIQSTGSGAGITKEQQAAVRELWGEAPRGQSGAKTASPEPAGPEAVTSAPAAEATATPAAEATATPGADATAAPVANATTAKKADPPWVAAARRYNNAHMALVDEFNKLTDNVFALDEYNTDPKAIANWQRKHGLAASGMIGPKTVAAARADKNNDTAVAKVDDGKKGELIDV